MTAGFEQRYGPWAVIAGGAQGIGAAYARYLARHGLKLIIVDRSAEALQLISDNLEQAHGTECLILQLDLADADRLAQLQPLIDGSFIEKNEDVVRIMPLILVGLFVVRGNRVRHHLVLAVPAREFRADARVRAFDGLVSGLADVV